MSNISIEDLHYEDVKSYFLFPEQSTLPKSKQEILARAVSAFKILDKNPTPKYAVALLRALYPEISRSTAYRDLRLAQRLFKSIHTFNYDFWHTWLINDILYNIQVCMERKDPESMEIVAMEHANLIKAIGQRPDESQDPRRNEKREFYITGSSWGSDKIDLEKLANLPVTSPKELTRIMRTGFKASNTTSKEIINKQ